MRANTGMIEHPEHKRLSHGGNRSVLCADRSDRPPRNDGIACDDFDFAVSN